MDGWYVVQTKPHKEGVVERELSSHRLAFFLPRIAERVRAGLHVQRRVAPMFPSYLFVNVDVSRWAKTIRYAPGVRDFLRADGVPQSVDPEIIESLRSRIGPVGIFVPPPRIFAPGDRLRIEAGPLRGLEVIFERELSGRERVAVLLAELNLPARIVLSAEALSRLS